jgi:VanZ family protein
MVRKLLVLLAWVSLGYIAYVTLSPIGLRPVASNNPAYERLVAYAIVGILFGLAYPGRIFMALGIVVGAAIALEGLQYLTPDRHGRLADLLEKISGGLFGVLVAVAASKYWLAARACDQPTNWRALNILARFRTAWKPKRDR